ncbi:uncharacterized protein AMSG_07127 [Thecamonas trahens ATCC 50062]|uniref:SGNH hydrolase-type esterase domain-containing protein n=1 Tax=Thecamonas trahens ATCC 50062 TaxID=461836 RepID=A0A0L0DEX6_THETB|nr:hypothetical protein AMSG_07127 [Thecamonas trahens ATCC 50062]KNC50892.1 hypothetical protein AMSG_07127 [Thecamonas trahens ATCC 50062]|eukprot:XP_013756598.1 hypothetical protein AMSG_07127 [Thecamonas trahens ATCC 50062]
MRESSSGRRGGLGAGAPSLGLRATRAVVAVLTNVFKVILFVVVTIREPLALAWLRLNVLLFQNVGLARRLARPEESPLPPRCVVVVGDGNAEGFGDWITFGTVGGIAPRLEGLLHADRRVRQRWHVLNMGATGASSEAWLPAWAGPPERFAWLSLKPSAPLWDQVFGLATRAREAATADVTLLMLGASDPAVGLTAPASWANIRALAAAIVEATGGVVYVATVPLAPSVTDVYLAQLNIHITHYFDDEQSPDEAAHFRRGPDLFQYFRSPRAGDDLEANFAWGGRILSSRGYAAAARLWADTLAMDLVRIEYDALAAALTSGGA